MAIKTLPSRELIHKLLSYDPATGILAWRPRPREMFANDNIFGTWNTRFVGKPAGYPRYQRVAGILRPHQITVAIGRIKFGAHRLAWLLVQGEPVPNTIDHIDGNPFNNCIANLRQASTSQNLANACRRRDNSTGAKSVQRSANGQKFHARIKDGTKNVHLGTFDTIEEAAQAYRDAAIKLYGEFARWE